MILACNNITKHFGENEILNGISFHVNENEKTAIVGINGAGKSTLFKIIVGELSADTGEVILAKGATYGYLSQHQDLTSENTIYEELLSTKAELLRMEETIRTLEQEMKHAKEETLEQMLSTYSRLNHEFEAQNGYAYRSEVVGILKGKNQKISQVEHDIKHSTLEKVTLSLLTSRGDVGHGSGINWGIRRNGTKREPNQAYISVPVEIARSGFFPLEKTHFSAITDDQKQLIFRIEQANDKALTTPLNNSLLGEYLRNRIGVANGAFVTKADLERYGRTDVTFYKIDDEQFFMDFSV